MTDRKCFADGALLAQLIEHHTFNLRDMGSSPISGSNRILYVLLCMETIFSCFLSIENVHHFSNIFQLSPVLFSCAVSDFLNEEFSCNTYSLCLYFLLKQLFLVYADRKCSPLRKLFPVIACII